MGKLSRILWCSVYFFLVDSLYLARLSAQAGSFWSGPHMRPAVKRELRKERVALSSKTISRSAHYVYHEGYLLPKKKMKQTCKSFVVVFFKWSKCGLVYFFRLSRVIDKTSQSRSQNCDFMWYTPNAKLKRLIVQKCDFYQHSLSARCSGLRNLTIAQI